MRSSPAQSALETVISNVTPVWLLYYWRLVQGEALGDYAVAWRALPECLPKGFSRPPANVAAAILVAHGLS